MTAKTPLTRAEILIQALPYIQSYHGRILVIKYGGNAMLSNELQQLVMRDIALLHQIGIKVVLVHGGGETFQASQSSRQEKRVYRRVACNRLSNSRVRSDGSLRENEQEPRPFARRFRL